MEKMPYRQELDTQVFQPAVEPVVTTDWQQGLPVLSGEMVTLRELPGENFDDSHVLIVNLASVQAFALEAGMALDPRRFRANLYLEGLEPEEELRWLGRTIRAGKAELEVTSRCERCCPRT